MDRTQMIAFEEAYISFARLWGMQTTANYLTSNFVSWGVNLPSGERCGFRSEFRAACQYIRDNDLIIAMDAACIAAGVGSMLDYADAYADAYAGTQSSFRPRQNMFHRYYSPRPDSSVALCDAVRHGKH